jgi:cytochrome c-type biogenesis protein CcmH/NrfG
MAAPATASPTVTTMVASDASAGSMQAATLALKTRLAVEGGPDDQWELLAQSYDFLGRSAEAKLAREHKTSASTDLRDAIAVSTMLLPTARAMASSAVTARTGANPAATLIASAEQHRRKREFKEACADYAGVLELGAMTADTWADYADAQASLAGQLAGEPAKAIDRALGLDPRHTKALWLKASLAHEQHRYKDALTTWQRLLTLMPPGSSDARIVEANLAEASRLSTS